LDFGLPDSLAHLGGSISYFTTGPNSLLSSSPKMSLEKASGLALMQLCRAINGCTQSEPYIYGANFT